MSSITSIPTSFTEESSTNQKRENQKIQFEINQSELDSMLIVMTKIEEKLEKLS
jgi:hypothetical protein